MLLRLWGGGWEDLGDGVMEHGIFARRFVVRCEDCRWLEELTSFFLERLGIGMGGGGKLFQSVG